MEGISKLLRTSGKRRLDKTRQSYSVLPDGLCRRFSLADINTATSNFDDDLVIGEGSYGKVYKGFIDHPTTTSVAIKRVDIKSRQIFDELRTELLLLCQLHHPNLVPLIGYYLDDQQVILVYEFIPNGTLSKYLHFQEHVCDPLSWKQRLQICIGVARALHYLHSGVKHSIIHRNVKTSNILLDEKLEPKLINFGDYKMGPPSLSKDLPRMVSEVVGTVGYLDPEYAMHWELTDKSDVYSFGVVMFRVLCARSAVRRELETDEAHLATWARKCIQEGTIYQIIDPYLKGKIAPECFKIYMDIANSCVRNKGKDRPTITEVEVVLEHALELQESADAAREDVDPSGGDQYKYPIVEYTCIASPPEFEGSLESEGSISDSDSTTSAELSLDVAIESPNGQ
ncbi:hypothetical protein CMV_015737 [Castanea mollissima]|uniref:Protein kinase domain-containing protein n=1 Tax=Castanea mollissima TaxID=60419 RepID=A0A8J4R4S8_9ROSI|nr:hypothetical protein CMV_015737 [Castanea mollissima]